MSNVREYLRQRSKRGKEKTPNYGALIQKHRLSVLSKILLIIAVILGIGFSVYNKIQGQVFTGYTVISATPKAQYDSSANMSFGKGFLTYSKDGISYTDSRGNAMWNKTYEMQNPLIRVKDGRVAVADYNGHIIYNIAESGESVEIDTNLPIRELTVSESGMVAAVLEDTSITWINMYNSMGEKVAYLKTTMQKSGYPLAIALSPDGKLLAVSYLSVESGSMKSSVAFYNFSSVGQNFVDNFASGADYADAVIPYINFMDSDTAFAVADNRLVFYSGDQRPKSIADVLLDEEIQSVFYNETNVGLVYVDTTGQGKYRMDVYGTNGFITQTIYLDMDYKDIIMWKENILIYNETHCLLVGKDGLIRYEGEFEKAYTLLIPINTKRYTGVSKESIDVIEMK